MFRKTTSNGGNDAVSTIERELAGLRERQTELTMSLTSARTAVDLALADRRRLLTVGDHKNAELRHEADRAVAATQGTEAGMRDALDQISAQIDDAQGRLDQERDARARRVEADQRAKQLGVIEIAQRQYERAAKELSDALSGLEGPLPQAAHIRMIVARTSNDITAAVVDAGTVLKGYCAAVLAGAPMQPQASQTQVAKAKPAIERMNIMLVRAAKWSDPEQGLMAGGELRVISPPRRVAELALQHGHAVLPTSERARQLVACSQGGVEYAPFDVNDKCLVDLEKPMPVTPELRPSGVVHSEVVAPHRAERQVAIG